MVKAISDRLRSIFYFHFLSYLYSRALLLVYCRALLFVCRRALLLKDGLVANLAFLEEKANNYSLICSSQGGKKRFSRVFFILSMKPDLFVYSGALGLLHRPALLLGACRTLALTLLNMEKKGFNKRFSKVVAAKNS